MLRYKKRKHKDRLAESLTATMGLWPLGFAISAVAA